MQENRANLYFCFIILFIFFSPDIVFSTQPQFDATPIDAILSRGLDGTRTLKIIARVRNRWRPPLFRAVIRVRGFDSQGREILMNRNVMNLPVSRQKNFKDYSLYVDYRIEKGAYRNIPVKIEIKVVEPFTSCFNSLRTIKLSPLVSWRY
ncbi:hypothetical protein ACFL35_10020 [Candidatus Riflebacteria bacterium]